MALGTLGVWDANLARLGAEIVAARLRLVADLSPLLGKAYEAVARGATRDDATMVYRCSFPAQTEPAAVADQDELEQATAGRARTTPRATSSTAGSAWSARTATTWCSRSVTCRSRATRATVSRGPSRSRCGSRRTTCCASTGDDPILVLDDVFAELDTGRRQQLAELVGDAEQVLVTAAVADDVPEALRGTRYTVADGDGDPR